MTKDEALAKFNRISNDPRQAQAFVKDLLDGKLIEPGTKLYKHKFQYGVGRLAEIITTSNESIVIEQRYGNTFLAIKGTVLTSLISFSVYEGMTAGIIKQDAPVSYGYSIYDFIFNS